jgi:hypothetical protein
MADFKVPLIIRGEIIDDYEVEHIDRSANGRSFLTPDAGKYAHRLASKSAAILEDLYTISFDEIVDYLAELGERLDLDTNPWWREAFEISCGASNLSRPVLEEVYRSSPLMFRPQVVREFAELRIGVRYLEGWVSTRLADGRTIEVRAMGSRSAHVIAGNIPIVATITQLRSAITRNDTLVKVPSNDPLTMGAIARTMIEMAPNHPLTKHLSVAYWKGGDERIEQKIYQPQNIEKLVAWGGMASVKHITKYLQPGIDMITLDPKTSTTLIGREALADDETMRYVARRAAADLGGLDQEACVNARVIYLEAGTDPQGIALANQFGKCLFDAVQELPKRTSGGVVKFDPALKAELDDLRAQEDFFHIITEPGQIERRGAVIVSQFGEQVDFPRLLYGRVGNVVPVDNIEDVLVNFSSATQTVGVYPDALRKRIRDRAAIMGGQMFVPLGYAIGGSICGPQDGIEPERRLCRWVLDTHSDPALIGGPWMHDEEMRALHTA